MYYQPRVADSANVHDIPLACCLINLVVTLENLQLPEACVEASSVSCVRVPLFSFILLGILLFYTCSIFFRLLINVLYYPFLSWFQYFYLFLYAFFSQEFSTESNYFYFSFRVLLSNLRIIFARRCSASRITGEVYAGGSPFDIATRRCIC